MTHEVFKYKSLDEIRKRAEELGVHLPFAADTSALFTPISLGNRLLPNRIGTAPMEGADALPDGSPSGLTARRYIRNVEGGSAIIWFEAVSIVKEGRSSAHQLYICEDNLDAYKRLTERLKEAGYRKNGFYPYLIMQANHSGRYSNPDGRPAPLIAYRNPELEKTRAADDSCTVSDEYVKNLVEEFGKAASIAERAGFDAVDIKSCHGYLLSEFSSSYIREGRYGGLFENREKLLLDSIRAAKPYESDHFMVTARIGVYDGFCWPYGFGVSKGGDETPDYREPIRLIREIRKLGVRMVDLTMGNPYVNPHITRPFNIGKYVPEEHPLVGVSRMINGIGRIRKEVPGMIVYASGPSYLREYSDLYSAGAIEEGLCDGMLFGRMSFAYPDFPNDVRANGRMDKNKVCLACGKCGDLIRAGKPTGCVVREPEIYLPYFREYQRECRQAQ